MLTLITLRLWVVTSATPADENLPETIVEKDHKVARYVIWAFPIKRGFDGHVRGVCGFGVMRKLSPELGSEWVCMRGPLSAKV